MKVNIIGVRKSFEFLTDEGFSVYVDDFKGGFAYIEIPVNIVYGEDEIYTTILNSKEYIHFISGCFKNNSNFKERLFRAFGCSKDTEFKGIRISIQEFYKLITIEDSFVLKINEIIDQLLTDFTVHVLKEENEEKLKQEERTREINKLLDSLEVAFKSDRAEDEYEEAPTEISDEDLGYGEDFVKYVQYLHREKDQDIFDAVIETYITFVGYWTVPENDGQIMNFICKYCKYGDEIFEAYTEILTQAFADELDNL